MNRTVQLDIPEDVFEALAKVAEQEGQQVETTAVQLLTNILHKQESKDPLEQFIGAFVSPPDQSDWADNHDNYLGEGLYNDMVGKEPNKGA